MITSKEKSFSVHILRISIYASLLSICVVGTFFFFEYQSQRTEKLFLTAHKLIMSSDQQSKTVTASLLVKEEFDAIELLKKEVKRQEGLNDLQVTTNTPIISNWNTSDCRRFEAGSLACIDYANHEITTLFEVKLGAATLGYLIKRKTIEAQASNEIEDSMLALLAGLLVSTLVIFFFGRRFIYNRVRNPLLQMVDDIEPAITSGSFKTMKSYGVREVEILAEKLDKLVQRLKISQTKLVESEKDAAAGQIAAQVSHDIRSPLAALEMVSESLDGIEEEKRLILRNSITRIRDIANSLVFKNKMSCSSESALIAECTEQTEHPSEVALLASLIETIVSEKRMQYRNKLSLCIEFNQTIDSYGVFCKVGPVSFQRIISNLIDNSVESMTHKSGLVKICLRPISAQDVEVQIIDSGHGMPENVLNKLGQRGFTQGKQNGTGLGVFYAKECVNAWGGQFAVASHPNRGTQITIRLKIEPSPSWFVSKLQLCPGSKVIVFDDDQSIHQIWDERLKSKSTFSRGLEILHFSSASEVRKFYSRNFQDMAEDMFLMDHEILGTSETGLDLIESLGINKQAILVTSHYENPDLRFRCKKLNVRMIPKPMSGFVPVEILALGL